MRPLLKCVLALVVALPATLPAQSNIPTPESVFGFAPGTDKKLANYEQVVEILQEGGRGERPRQAGGGGEERAGAHSIRSRSFRRGTISIGWTSTARSRAGWRILTA